jgi:NAD(P) transhydrogenase
MSEGYDFDMLVIGSGPAGQKAAIQAARLHKRVAIIERMDLLGGYCANNTTIPSKSFKEAIASLSGYRQRSIYGANYRVKSEIQMSDLTFRCSQLVQTLIMSRLSTEPPAWRMPIPLQFLILPAR